MYKYLDRKPLKRSQAQIQFNNIYTFGYSVAKQCSLILPPHPPPLSFVYPDPLSAPNCNSRNWIVELLYYGYFIIIIYNIIGVGGGITMGHGPWGREWNGIVALR